MSVPRVTEVQQDAVLKLIKLIQGKNLTLLNGTTVKLEELTEETEWGGNFIKIHAVITKQLGKASQDSVSIAWLFFKQLVAINEWHKLDYDLENIHLIASKKKLIEKKLPIKALLETYQEIFDSNCNIEQLQNELDHNDIATGHAIQHDTREKISNKFRKPQSLNKVALCFGGTGVIFAISGLLLLATAPKKASTITTPHHPPLNLSIPPLETPSTPTPQAHIVCTNIRQVFHTLSLQHSPCIKRATRCSSAFAHAITNLRPQLATQLHTANPQQTFTITDRIDNNGSQTEVTVTDVGTHTQRFLVTITLCDQESTAVKNQ